MRMQRRVLIQVHCISLLSYVADQIVGPPHSPLLAMARVTDGRPDMRSLLVLMAN